MVILSCQLLDRCLYTKITFFYTIKLITTNNNKIILGPGTMSGLHLETKDLSQHLIR